MSNAWKLATAGLRSDSTKTSDRDQFVVSISHALGGPRHHGRRCRIRDFSPSRQTPV